MKLEPVSPAATGSNPAPGTRLTGSPAASAPSAPAPVALATPPARPAPDAAAARRAAQQINEFLKSSSASVEFMVDERSNKVIVRVVDTETRQVIRQMPSEEMLAIAQALDRMTGLLLAQRA